MTAIITKASVLAIVEETTEGTPVSPSAAGDFIALQDDASMTPSFDVLENAEFKNSIGKAKPILGAENPTFEMSHYLRASGTAAVAPGYNLLLKSAFGDENVRSTERSTTTGSTVAVLELSANGSEFSKGDFVLIKDATNGYRIRALESVSTNSLTMGFQLPNAPASGVALGKDVNYKPASTGHIPLSVWHYLGNGGAKQMMSGGKVTSFGFEATAGELINANFSVEGLEYYFNPIEITASNKYLDFNDGSERNASIAEGMYKDPYELAEALQTAGDALATNTLTVTYSPSTGKFTIAVNTGTLSLLWNTGTNTANTIGTTLGFSVAADDTAATTYTSDNAISFAASYTPSYDSADPLAAKDHEVMLGESTDYACFHPSSVSFSLANTRSVAGDICAASGRGSSVMSERVVEVNVSSLLNQYDAQQFYRYRTGEEIKFQYSFGVKSGGNWVAGKCGGLYIGSATISELTIDDADGLVQLNLKLSAFINSAGDGEVFLGFL